VIHGLLALALLQGAAQKPGSLTGTWEWGDAERGGGFLLVVDEPTQVRFQLQLWRGAPSYNMGFLEGQLSVKDGKATFSSREADMACDITFAFQGNKVVLRQTGSDAACGFGHAVAADGTYERTSRKKPVFQEQP
jgi:hypothetical protein